ncbi:MAG TPA: hypothetical protein VMD55_01940 [Terracidiphilus sp.]|nr:hypothetical protein [Terracidiphilus sp.]
MPSSAETVCASSAPVEYELESVPLWFLDPIEIPENLRIRFRAVAWGLSLSVLLWVSAFAAGRALWNWWR